MNSVREKLMGAVFLSSALASILAVALICVFLLANGLPAVGKIGVFNFLLGREWSPADTPPVFGIFPMILGSLYVTAGAVIIGVPTGVLAAIFLARVCPKKLYHILKPGVELLAGIPSVV
jgi:phosphate transport system permease protein